MLATNRLNQSSPRPAAVAGKLARRESAEPWLSSAPGIRSLLIVGGSRGLGTRSGLGRSRLHQREWTRTLLVCRGGLQFVLAHAQRHRRIAPVGIEAQQRPFHGDAPIADPEKAAEVDDGNAHAAA